MHKTIASASYQKLIQYLCSEREKSGLSMREIADRLDVSHSWIHKVESLERRLDVYEFVKYCEALNIDPHVALELVK